MRRLLKVELHLHLDCSLSYSVVCRLDRSVSREEYQREFVAPDKCRSLADFLTRAPRGFQLMQSEDALRLVVDDLFEQLVRDRVIYAEIRFAPLLHTAGGLSPRQVVEIVDRATEQAIRTTGVEARLILCTLRHFNRHQSCETVELVDQYRGSRVAAFDIAGDEAQFTLEPHIPAFHRAMDLGLGRTAHAGEAAGADSVRRTLQELKPSRLGHGIRSIEDGRLIEQLRRERVHLEVCPTSNIQTNVYDDYAHHPVDRLYRAGVPLSINTDTRTITNVTLAEEYDRLRGHFQWTDSEFLTCNQNALRAAFLPPMMKARLLSQLEQSYGIGIAQKFAPTSKAIM